jgi:hypothetical protein
MIKNKLARFTVGLLVAVVLALLSSCATTDGQNSFESAKFSGTVLGVRSTITIGSPAATAADNK